MNDVQFKSLDLNLFRTFLAVLECRSVSIAARDLSITPSAVSHALTRLRAALGDPLFERRGGGMTPTPYAIELGRRAAPALEGLRSAIEPLIFEPRDSERQFVLTGGSYAAAVILPKLLDKIRETAPRVRIRFLPIAADFVDSVERGRVDIAFGTGPPRSARVEWLPLLLDDMVWVARRSHPHVRAPLTMAMLLRARHVVLDNLRPVVGDEYHEAQFLLDEVRELRTAQALDFEDGRVVASASDLSHAFTAVLGSDAVTLTLRRYAQAAAPGVIQLLEPPHRTPKVTIGAVFASDRDLGVNWLLEQIKEFLAKDR
ncbi:MAG: LysR family transcriptional regulator [Phenylobacterium sp.]|uniref:LysR family transcriptional regulator n=1 Tax=Phenylobacterium sp. TaxID=1871053 RepID=UPI001A187F58|nr:LysR family transcriptional regulator [Phenylobacterium sp.]MBJ7411543.1 LysR family transcriptional regulator [Phenylobacterium sp.]